MRLIVCVWCAGVLYLMRRSGELLGASVGSVNKAIRDSNRSVVASESTESSIAASSQDLVGHFGSFDAIYTDMDSTKSYLFHDSSLQVVVSRVDVNGSAGILNNSTDMMLVSTRPRGHYESLGGVGTWYAYQVMILILLVLCLLYNAVLPINIARNKFKLRIARFDAKKLCASAIVVAMTCSLILLCVWFYSYWHAFNAVCQDLLATIIEAATLGVQTQVDELANLTVIAGMAQQLQLIDVLGITNTSNETFNNAFLASLLDVSDFCSGVGVGSGQGSMLWIQDTTPYTLGNRSDGRTCMKYYNMSTTARGFDVVNAEEAVSKDCW